MSAACQKSHYDANGSPVPCDHTPDIPALRHEVIEALIAYESAFPGQSIRKSVEGRRLVLALARLKNAEGRP